MNNLNPLAEGRKKNIISPSTPNKNFFSNSPNKSFSKPPFGNKSFSKPLFGNKSFPKPLPAKNKGAKLKVQLKKNLKIKRVLSFSQILGRIRQQRQQKVDQQKSQKTRLRPIIPPKSLIIILKDRPRKVVYNGRIIDYKNCGLLQRYIGLGGKILPRRQTWLTAKQQRYVAKTIKSARIMGLLPFVSKERGFFR